MMLDRKLTPQIVSNIYKTALEPDYLKGLLAIAHETMCADAAGFFVLENGQLRDLVVTQDIRESLPDYMSYYHSIDPWGGGRCPRMNDAFLGTESIGEKELLRTEFYNDFAVDYGMRRPMGIALDIAPNLTACMSMNRAAVTRLLSEDDKPLLNDLGFHIRSALRLNLRYREDRSAGAWNALALDALQFGAVVCTAKGAVLHANRAALDLAAEHPGLSIGDRRNGIRAARPREADGLATLIRNACQGVPGAMRLFGPAGSTLCVLATPLGETLPVEGGGRALLSLRRIDATAASQAAMLRQLFGLSPTQADLCVRLADGQTFEQIALERGFAITTARAHFRTVLSKTGARNLRELLRMLAALPPVRYLPR